MDRFYNYFSSLGQTRLRWDDDIIDRLHRCYTAFLLAMFAILVTTKQYVGEPVYCWAPETWSLGHQRYADQVCWISNTYWIPYWDNIPMQLTKRERGQIGYYQWVPFALLIQAFLFFAPCAFWRLFNDKSGINVQTIIELCIDAKNISYEHRQRVVTNIAKFLTYSFENHKDYRKGKCIRLYHFLSRSFLVVGKKYGNFLFVLYMIIKFFYIINAGLQLYVINKFIGVNHTFYGLEIFQDFWQNGNWMVSGRFPRVAMCDFLIRVMGNVHRHTVQCVLPINMFNEKIYIFMWFWFVLLIIITIYNFSSWIYRIMFSRSRSQFIKNQINLRIRRDSQEKAAFNKFVHKFLRFDGVFVLRLVALNCGDLMAHEIVEQMWAIYKEEYCDIPENNLLTNSVPRGHHNTNKLKSDRNSIHSTPPISPVTPTAPPADGPDKV